MCVANQKTRSHTLMWQWPGCGSAAALWPQALTDALDSAALRNTVLAPAALKCAAWWTAACGSADYAKLRCNCHMRWKSAALWNTVLAPAALTCAALWNAACGSADWAKLVCNCHTRWESCLAACAAASKMQKMVVAESAAASAVPAATAVTVALEVQEMVATESAGAADAAATAAATCVDNWTVIAWKIGDWASAECLALGTVAAQRSEATTS